jgi:hypothetical protein
MNTSQINPLPQPITSEYLSSLTEVQLADLILQKSKIIINARNSHLKTNEYIQLIEKDIKAINEEIKKRG